MESSRLNSKINEIIDDFKQNLVMDLAMWAKYRTPSELFDFEQELLKSMNVLHNKIFSYILDEIHQDKEFVTKCQSDAQSEQKLRNMGWRTTSVRSLNGRKASVTTPYLSPCQKSPNLTNHAKQDGIYPVLRRLGIIRGSSPRFLSEVNRQMTDGPSTAEAIERLGNWEIHISKKKMQTMVRDFGSVALWQRQVATQNLNRIKPHENGRFYGKRVVIGLDGGRIRIRINRITEDQTISNCYTTNKCEPKLFAIYAIDEKGNKERGEDIFYDGTIQPSEYLFDLLQLRLKQLGIHGAQLLVIVGDGAPWIWNGISKLRRRLRLGKLRLIEIIDWAHAVGKLSQVAKIGIRLGPQQQRWFRKARRMLKNGEIAKLIKAFSELDSKNDKENCISNTQDYFQTHRLRMQYPKFQKEGLPIGSGVIESGIRRIVNLRLHGASIFWLPETAEQILYLRCQLKSGQWNNFLKSTLEQWATEMKFPLKKTYEVNEKIAADYHKTHPPQLISHTRPEVIKWAQELMKNENLLILDTETTGLGDYDEIIQLAIIDIRGRVRFHKFIQPMTEISDEAFAVHGITDQKISAAPCFADVYGILRGILHDRDIIAYNAEFDKRMIEQTCRKNGLEPLNQVTWHCLMKKYAFFLGRRRKNGTYIAQTLKSACEQQGISIKDAHDALNDCLATLELIKAIEATDPS